MGGMAVKFSSLFFVASLTVAPVCGLSSTATAQPATPPCATTALPNVVVEAPRQVARPQKPEPRTVAHSAEFPRTSIASASDAPVYGRTTLATTTGNCSTTTWPTISPVQCTKPVAHNYVECTEMVAKNGSRATDAWWWCSNQGFKN
jgi:hypothetical protein